MISARLAFLTLILLAEPAAGAITPKPGTGDPRIQSARLDAGEIVSLTVALGYQLTLEMSAGDRIESVAVGNAAAWQVTPNKGADRIFIKPMQGAGDTNLSVVTATRTYVFELHAASYPTAATPFLVKMEPPPVTSASERPVEATYVYRGDRRMRPTTAIDDGRSVSIGFDPSKPLPAVYAIGDDGKERLVNAAVRDGHLVIDEIAKTFVLRRDGHSGRLIRRQVPGER